RRAASHDWTGRTGSGAALLGVSALARVPVVMTLPLPDPLYEGQAKRQAHAAAALLKLGEAEAAWPLLRHTPDPSVRSYLVWRLAGLGPGPGGPVRGGGARAGRPGGAGRGGAPRGGGGAAGG